MMYIVCDNGVSGPPVEYHWCVGESTPFKYNSDLAQFVSVVQADGDELTYIERNFRNLPQVGGSNGSGRRLVQRWYGDHAKFIAGNL